MKKVLKVIGIILLVLVVIGVLIWNFVLNYPELKNNPKEGKWYHITNSNMKSSDGSSYRAFFKKGSENKVIVYFAGGGASFNEETAKDTNFYFSKQLGIDFFDNLTMNMGGIVTISDANPFKDWSFILVPYTTGDWHSGNNEFKYTGDDGNEKILYHNGYVNYQNIMEEVLKYTDLEDAESVIVTGYSAGGFGAAFLADDVFTNYFTNADSKTVLVDSSYLLSDDWSNIVNNVWKSPINIAKNITSNNITLDLLKALREKWGDKVNILYDTSIRDGELARYQVYLDGGKLESTDNLSDPDGLGDMYQEMLKTFIPELEEIDASIFVWDGISFYGQDNNLTQHTIIATAYAFQELGDTNKSIAGWLIDATGGKLESYGLDLLDKEY